MNQMTPIAAGIASLGRGNDKMLVHMTPGEVQGLQSLAMAHGGSLTINPQTGLPEAGFLENILPTVLGVGLSFMGVPAWAAGLGVGAFQGLRTGDLGQGLMAGLQAFGGAGLGGALTAQGAGIMGHEAGLQAIGGADNFVGANFAPVSQVPPPPDFLAPNFVDSADAIINPNMVADAASAAPIPTTPNPLGQAYVDAFQKAQPTDVMGRLRAAGTGLQNITEPGFMANLGQQFPSTTAKAAAGIGGIGALGGFEQPQLKLPAMQEQPSNYRAQGPNRRPFDPTAPGGYYYTDRGIIQPAYAAKGGEMHSVPQLEDGGFVLTKKAVDGIGGGDNERGQRRAAAGLGAIPIKGPGTGTSDSIRTSIDGVRPAAVSNGEAYIPRNQVKRRGGAKKFYALMKKAERAAGKRRV